MITLNYLIKIHYFDSNLFKTVGTPWNAMLMVLPQMMFSSLIHCQATILLFCFPLKNICFTLNPGLRSSSILAILQRAIHICQWLPPCCTNTLSVRCMPHIVPPFFWSHRQGSGIDTPLMALMTLARASAKNPRVEYMCFVWTLRSSATHDMM